MTCKKIRKVIAEVASENDNNYFYTLKNQAILKMGKKLFKVIPDFERAEALIENAGFEKFGNMIFEDSEILTAYLNNVLIYTAESYCDEYDDLVGCLKALEYSK